MAAGSGGGGFLGDVNDPWLKPRLLRAVVTGRLPQPGAAAELSPTEVASILEVVRTHGLLTEDLPGRGALVNPKLAEAWRAAVDAWVERVVALVESDSTYSCWLGTCFLGVTFQECRNDRFAESHSIWFEKILSNLQQSSSFQLVIVISCTSMSDLFVRLAKFSNLKKEGSSFAGRVVEPVLRLLNQNGLVADEAIDLLRTVIKLYPSSVNRHYNKVESAIAAKIMSNVKPSEKFARTLALLPSVRVSEDSWSLMIRRILIVFYHFRLIFTHSTVTEKKGHDIMLLLVPPGTDPLPTLGDEVMPGGNVHIMKKFRVFTVPTISALTLCCSVMLTSYYPVQVNVPIHALIALMRRVLLVDGSLHNKLFPSTTSLHQELICFDLPSLHSTFLDLLNATIKGMRSQLLPHGASIIRLITEYFKIAKLPTLRTKTYSILQLLLTSMGVGTSLHLLEATVRNAVADLNDDGEINMTMINTNSSQLTNESSSKVYSKKRKQEPQMQNSTISGSEKVAISPRKRKGSSIPITSKGVAPESTGDVTLSTPHSVKIAALETLEVLLNVGGSLRMDRWRSEVDMLLINVARSACGMGGSYEQKPSTFGEPNISDFQLASLKGLLASFLSSHARPPYLANGIELFRKGKLEIGTKVAEFCSHALLALDVLVHPRALSLERTVPASSGFNYTAQKKTVFGAGTHQISPFGDQPQAMEVEDMYDDWLISNNNEPPEVPVNGSDAVVSKGVLVEDGKQLNPIAEDPKVDPPRITDAAQDAPASTKTDVKVVDAAAATAAKPNTAENPSSSNAVPSPVRTTDSDSRKHASFPEQDSPHENKSAAVHPGEASATPGVGSSHHRHEAPEARSASFTELFGSESGIESESEDLMPDIVDGDPDSD
ncbi:proline-, glutamic acid- and leucine-rich protein 1 isoform X2 [Zea mays]|uniref:proline-, glutamic acid- and leucine-rich protein 1 isoform X2 n=1 Tax=Zea mays TaxID=4577 RepID=UPI0009A97302|nr:proline-, glutamic acid- and leucine-rich protein 1 isoform X2 [Zea mays]|eukprot:XP_020394002.1 proline-, glutamic acid- and leucine-rich protein 1 isoform X2 [Zea mays]